MKLWFAWVGVKKDLAGKAHLWGILNRDEGTVSLRYVFQCSVGKHNTIVNLESSPNFNVENLQNKRRKKEENGYRQVSQAAVEKRWPSVIKDIEMQFLMEKLAE